MRVDCCILYDELELLELRLHTLREVVDLFVVCEAKTTYAGEPKPLHFLAAAERFKEFPIRYYVTPLPPPEPGGFPFGGRWPCEYALRNAIADALRPIATANDYVMISDVDEIPDPAHVGHIGTFSQALYLYKLNAEFPVRWNGTVGFCYHWLYYYTPQLLRAENSKWPTIEAGWHFSYQGGLDRILDTKFDRATDAEAVTPEQRAAAATRMRHLEDPRGRPPPAGLPPGRYVPVDERFPAYIRNNLDRWKDWIGP